uniref:Uncharacterized protein n=1 Tax=Aeromonas sp. Ne-1 TaxID=1675689 RepID=A0A0H4JMW5_9GAMM|nr:hypothetical protein [Aeromonas sp. Ne-1]AKO69666.1 hypothetical protein [Aeromonas sp. Ne-1]
MYKLIEILGTDKPIIREIGNDDELFTLEELSYLNEKPSEYTVSAYLQLAGRKSGFYKPLYSKKGVN